MKLFLLLLARFSTFVRFVRPVGLLVNSFRSLVWLNVNLLLGPNLGPRLHVFPKAPTGIPNPEILVDLLIVSLSVESPTTGVSLAVSLETPGIMIRLLIDRIPFFLPKTLCLPSEPLEIFGHPLMCSVKISLIRPEKGRRGEVKASVDGVKQAAMVEPIV